MAQVGKRFLETFLDNLTEETAIAMLENCVQFGITANLLLLEIKGTIPDETKVN